MSLSSKAIEDKAIWIFNFDTSAGDWNIVQGGTATGTITGSPTQTNATLPSNGNAYTFSGTGQYVKVVPGTYTQSPYGFGTSQYGIEAVFKSTTNASSGQSRQIYHVLNKMSLVINQTGNIVWTVTKGSNTHSVTSTTSLTNGKWQHVFAYADNTYLYLYINGVLNATSSSLGGNNSPNPSATRNIGTHNTVGSTQEFAGTIDFIAEYDSGFYSNNAYGSNVGSEAMAIAHFKESKSALYNKINYGGFYLERAIEFNEPYSLTPTRTGALNLGTFTENASNRPTWFETGGPNGGAGYWRFVPTTSSSTTTWFSALTSTATESASYDDEDYSAGFWFNLESLPTGTSQAALRIMSIASTTTAGFAVNVTGSGFTSPNANKLYIATGGTAQYSTNALEANKWYYFAIRRVGSTGNNYFAYLNGTQFANWANTTVGSATSTEWSLRSTAMPSAIPFKISNYYATASNQVDATTISEIWTIGDNTVPVEWPASAMLVSNAEMIDPVVSSAAEAQIFPEAMTASSEFVYPALALDLVLDAFGYGEASADSVHPTISVESNVSISADPQTASAEMTEATITATSEVTISAGLFEASALLSNNVYAGRTVQDTAYNLHIRDITATTNVTGNSGFTIAANNGSVTEGVYISTNTGFPTPRTELKKVKINSPHVTAVSTNDVAPYNTFKVYRFNADTSAVYTTMTLGTLPAKTYLYTTRLVDDGANPEFYLDLTRAFIEDTNDYGIWLEIDTDVNTGSNDQTQFTGTNLNNQLLYVLSSELVNVNYNETAITASAEFANPVISTTRFIDYSASPATVSGLFVDPDVEVQVAGQYTAQEMNSTALMANATFKGEISYTPDHMEAFAQKPASTVSATQTVNYSATVSTASALFHEPQTQIGEINSVASMDGSALFVNPQVLLVVNYPASPMIAANAEMIQPAPLPALNANIQASAMTANAVMEVPPAYESLFDDKYYSLVYPQHASPHPFSPTGAKGILKMFSDVDSTISLATPFSTRGTLQNNIPRAYQNGNPGDPNDGDVFSFSNNNNALGTTGSVTPGFFDDYNRKAVRWQNIQLTNDTGSYIYGFTTELFIKTTKSNQILAAGLWGSATGNQKRRQTFGLVDGRLYVMAAQWISGSFPDLHPDNYNTLSGLSNISLWDKIEGIKRIDDGQWHHIVLQAGYNDQRVQFWIDGQLDIQRIGYQLVPVSSLGYNSVSGTYSSDFYISAYSYDPFGFISEQEIDLHAYAAINYEPYKAEPMVASITATANNKAAGNRARALYLYWWPKGPGILRPKKNDTGAWGEFDDETFDPYLETMDWEKQPPQMYYGWDVFPVDINGYYVSELVKPEAYGGEQNIISSSLGGTVGPFSGPFPTFKRNTQGYFKDPITDARRYINLVNDIDLSQFDAIFFANYPDQSGELDQIARNESVDEYFGKIEKELYEDFVKSLKQALDTGISLYITNTQLALDLGIVDRIEEVPLLQDTQFQSDPYAPTIAPNGTYPTGGAAQWIDIHANNRNRVRQLIPGLTDDACYIWTDAVFYKADDIVTGFGEPDRPSYRYEKRANGLNVGDEFISSNVELYKYPRNYLATPIANIKAGKAVTTFGSTIRAGVNQVANPYANYATTIVVEPGDILNGKQSVGKIFVNFTEKLFSRKGYGSNDYGRVDLVQDFWINEAYNTGAISEARRNELLNSQNNIDRLLEQDLINEQAYNLKAYWSNNAEYILVQSEQLQGTDVVGTGGIQQSDGRFSVTKINRSGTAITSTKTYSSTTFFSFKYSRQFQTLNIDVPSILTRGFRWLSRREIPEGLIQRPLAATAGATMVNPVVVADKIASVNAQAMVASAQLAQAQGYPLTSINNVSLPMNATATITPYVTRISAAPMTGTAEFRQNVAAVTSSVDEIVVYINHTDPILYLREDIIK